MDILSLAYKAREVSDACKSIYGERWDSIKQNVIENNLEPHHKENKTNNLLSSAIQLCEKEKDPKVQLILLGSAL